MGHGGTLCDAEYQKAAKREVNREYKVNVPLIPREEIYF